MQLHRSDHQVVLFTLCARAAWKLRVVEVGPSLNAVGHVAARLFILYILQLLGIHSYVSSLAWYGSIICP